jgi:hypothetical protein
VQEERGDKVTKERLSMRGRPSQMPVFHTTACHFVLSGLRSGQVVGCDFEMWRRLLILQGGRRKKFWRGRVRAEAEPKLEILDSLRGKLDDIKFRNHTTLNFGSIVQQTLVLSYELFGFNIRSYCAEFNTGEFNN